MTGQGVGPIIRADVTHNAWMGQVVENRDLALCPAVQAIHRQELHGEGPARALHLENNSKAPHAEQLDHLVLAYCLADPRMPRHVQKLYLLDGELSTTAHDGVEQRDRGGG